MFQKFHNRFDEFKTLYTVPHQYSGREILNYLGIRTGSPVVLFKEGNIRGEDERLEQTICEEVARAVVELRASVVDRGVGADLSGLLNAELKKRHHSGLYIGVAPKAFLLRNPRRLFADRNPLPS